MPLLPLKLRVQSVYYFSRSTTIIEEPEEPCSGSVSPPALEQLTNNSTYGNYNKFDFDELSQMSIDQLRAIATWQDAQIQYQNQYLDEKRSGKPKEHQLLLNAFQKLSQIQKKVINIPYKSKQLIQDNPYQSI